MARVVGRYLNDIDDRLRLDQADRQEIIRELETHIEDKVSEMKQAGLSEEEATRACLNVFGSARFVARQIYEAHSQGTWWQALLASLPHLLFGLIFVLNWWQGIGWVAIVLTVIIAAAIYGWGHGRPMWLFPWLGYSLIPVIVAGVLLLYLPKGWSWLAIVVYVPLALWLICFVAVQTIKRDWLYSALMLLPVPVMIAWFIGMADSGQVIGVSIDQVRMSAHWIGLSFMALALTVVAFMRLRQRWLRGTLLFVSGLLTLVLVTYARGNLTFFTFIGLVVIVVGLLLVPALIDKRLRSHRPRAAADSE